MLFAKPAAIHIAMSSRVLVADDHPAVASALCHTLTKSGFDVLPPVFRWSEVVPAVLSCAPDALLIDVEMPPGNGDGITAAASAVEARPGLVAVCISAHATPAIVERALEAGCRGFISKVAQVSEIPAVLKLAMESCPAFDHRTASMLTSNYRKRGEAEKCSRLTPRELDVLQHVCAGGSNPEIAARLFISRGTVAQLLSNVFEKLQVTDRAAAAATAVRLGIVE